MLNADDVANKSFSTVRLRDGYDVEEVDEFLRQIETALRAHEQTGGARTPPPPPGSKSGSDGLTTEQLAEAMRNPSIVASKVVQLALRRREEIIMDAEARKNAILDEPERLRLEILAESEEVKEKVVDLMKKTIITFEETIPSHTGNQEPDPEDESDEGLEVLGVSQEPGESPEQIQLPSAEQLRELDPEAEQWLSPLDADAEPRRPKKSSSFPSFFED